MDRESAVTIGYATATLDMCGVNADEVYGCEAAIHARSCSIACAPLAATRQPSRRDVSSCRSGAGFELREALAALNLLTD